MHVAWAAADYLIGSICLLYLPSHSRSSFSLVLSQPPSSVLTRPLVTVAMAPSASNPSLSSPDVEKRLAASSQIEPSEAPNATAPQEEDAHAVDEGSLRVDLLKGEDILALQDLDPALNLKMHLVNNVGASSALHMPVDRC